MRAGDSFRALPGPTDVMLVIEVSDSTRDYDRDTKLPIYAAARIPESWQVDLQADRIDRHTGPTPNGYRVVTRFGRGTVATSTAVPGVAVPVDTVVGDPE